MGGIIGGYMEDEQFEKIALQKHTRRKIEQYMGTIEQFNERIDTLKAQRKSVRYLPRKITKNEAQETFLKLNTNQINQTIERYQRFLDEGSEELVRLKSGGITTRWMYEESESLVNSVNNYRRYQRGRGLAGDKEIKLADDDIAYTDKKNRMEYMRGQKDIKDYFEALTKGWEFETDRTGQYKRNYLTAIQNNLGKGELYRFVEALDPKTLVKLYYSSPEIFDIKYVYPGDKDLTHEIEKRIALQAYRDAKDTNYETEVRKALGKTNKKFRNIIQTSR